MSDEKRVERLWLGYRHMVLPAKVSDIQLRETRRAFYAGADSIITSLMTVLDPSQEEPTEDDLNKMDEIRREFKEFAEAVKRGEA